MIVYLIGFMGSGKARYGKRLAKDLSFNFIDTDETIEKQEDLEITEIFKSKGEDYFRTIESELLTGISQLKNTIVATGGGMPCKKGNLDFMNNTGLTIYFKAGLGCVMKNLLREKEKRPMITNIDSTVLADYIHEKLEERKPCYQGSHASILTNNMKYETLINLVKEKLRL